MEGVIDDRDLFKMTTLNKGSLERETFLEEWIRSWRGNEPLTILSAEGWFTEGHVSGRYLWANPPTEMEVVLEMIAEVIQKKTFVMHVFVCPLLMTHLWRKKLGKNMDLMFTITTGLSCWPYACHEYLLCAVIF